VNPHSMAWVWNTEYPFWKTEIKLEAMKTSSTFNDKPAFTENIWKWQSVHSDPPAPYQPYALSQDTFIFGFDTTAYVSVTKPELSVNHFKSFP